VFGLPLAEHGVQPVRLADNEPYFDGISLYAGTSGS
jgi:hypothetical protein